MTALITTTEILAALYIAALFIAYVQRRLAQRPSHSAAPAPLAPLAAPKQEEPVLVTRPLIGSSQPAYTITVPVTAAALNAPEMSREEMAQYPGIRALRDEAREAQIRGFMKMKKPELLERLGYLN